MKILPVPTSQGMLGDSGEGTGYWLEEFAEAKALLKRLNFFSAARGLHLV